MAERVFVTGLGFATSIGNDVATVTSNLRHLQHGIEVVPDFHNDKRCPIAVLGTLKGFDTSSADTEEWLWPEPFSIRPETLRWMSPHVLYAAFAMDQAIRDSGLTETMIQSVDTGIYTASGGSPVTLHRNLSRMDKVGAGRCPPTGIVASVAGTLSFNLVALHGIQGFSCGFASACASSNHALGFAVDAVRNGSQKRMFVVGAEDGNRESVLPFAAMRALSPQTDPNKASRPFDKNRDGFVGTGGATVMVIESASAALQRQAPVYAEIIGWGQSSDGYNVAISHPEGLGLARAMQAALKDANLSPQQIEYVNAHGTSTPIGDIAEAKAMATVFGEQQPAISSTKALTGHGLSLAGVMEAAFCAIALKEQFIPGNAHLEEIDPDCSILSIPRSSEDTPFTTLLTNSSGFGGANVAVAMRSSTVLPSN